MNAEKHASCKAYLDLDLENHHGGLEKKNKKNDDNITSHNIMEQTVAIWLKSCCRERIQGNSS